jgi:hypothetical protein
MSYDNLHGCVRPIPTAFGGTVYRSRFEAEVAKELDAAGIEFEYEPHRVRTEGVSYLPDFLLANGVYLEAKGWFKKESRDVLRRLQFVEPDMDIRLVFQNPGQKLKPLKMTAAKWCDRNGFAWCKGPQVPPEWALN